VRPGDGRWFIFPLGRGQWEVKKYCPFVTFEIFDVFIKTETIKLPNPPE